MDPDDERDDEEGAGQGWLTTWADMMSVLLTFFIVLQAFSTISERKFAEAVTSIQRAFTIPLPVHSPGSPGFRPRESEAEELEERILDEDVAGISVEDYGDRLIVRMDSELLFSLGSAELTPEGREMIDRAAQAIALTKGRVRIEGHTCDLPLGPHNEYRDNWWLSSARAVNVLEALTKDGIPPERLVAAGYGQYDPIAPNDSEENRRKNRRVDFVIEKERRFADAP